MKPVAMLAAVPRWLASHAAIVGVTLSSAFTLAAVLVVLVLTLNFEQPDNPDKLAQDWDAALAPLQINPVFPPTEDVHVGDILAAEVRRRGDNRLEERNIFLFHAPGTEEALHDAYQSIPRFPPTPDNYDGTKPVEFSAETLAGQGTLTSLPIVALPEIAASAATTQTAVGILPWIRAQFGLARTASRSVRLRIPEAEVYGLPAIFATNLINNFCKPDKAPIPPCTDAYLRGELAAANWHLLDPSAVDERCGKAANANDTTVYLRLIRRIYLTRTIDYVFGYDTALGAHAKEKLDRAEAEASSPPAAGAGTRGQSPQTSDEALARAKGPAQGGGRWIWRGWRHGLVRRPREQRRRHEGAARAAGRHRLSIDLGAALRSHVPRTRGGSAERQHAALGVDR